MLTRAPIDGEFAPYFRKLERMSSALAFTSDLTMGVVGGKLKFMERLSARLGDVLSQLYIASAVLKFYLEGSKSDAEREDRKSVGEGKRVSIRVDIGGGRD